MQLFDIEAIANILPYDGVATYYEEALDAKQALFYFERLLHTVQWKNDEVIIFSKHFVTKRKTAWYGDADYSYTYSNTTKKALLWIDELLRLKQLAETKSATTFNSCLLNLYRNGDEGMGWHSDDEKSLKENAPITSISLGAERKVFVSTQTNKRNHFTIVGKRKFIIDERDNSGKLGPQFA